MLQDEKTDDSGRPLFAVQGGMRGHNATKGAADSHVSVSTGSEWHVGGARRAATWRNRYFPLK